MLETPNDLMGRPSSGRLRRGHGQHSRFAPPLKPATAVAGAQKLKSTLVQSVRPGSRIAWGSFAG
ncbi:hypothetical protein Pssp01_27300 [Pseudomonas sp. NBRC 100443]|nr:hypothetical protein Pssp01_27300 [Pseudomonas sp. NBRC 100443]